MCKQGQTANPGAYAGIKRLYQAGVRQNLGQSSDAAQKTVHNALPNIIQLALATINLCLFK